MTSILREWARGPGSPGRPSPEIHGPSAPIPGGELRLSSGLPVRRAGLISMPTGPTVDDVCLPPCGLEPVCELVAHPLVGRWPASGRCVLERLEPTDRSVSTIETAQAMAGRRR